jgi:hypothetical protein
MISDAFSMPHQSVSWNFLVDESLKCDSRLESDIKWRSDYWIRVEQADDELLKELFDEYLEIFPKFYGALAKKRHSEFCRALCDRLAEEWQLKKSAYELYLQDSKRSATALRDFRENIMMIDAFITSSS